VGVTAVTIGHRTAAEPMRFSLPWGDEYSVWLLNFGLACCAVEFVAATMSHPDVIRASAARRPEGPAPIDVIVVSGTVTDKMAPAIKRVYDELPDPKYVISFGSCANSGGPYWDSYCVTKGVDQIMPVDVYVPGCPPRPEALIAGLGLLHDKLAEGS
jgi:NADH-quinone oxidoreductase subunit B